MEDGLVEKRARFLVFDAELLLIKYLTGTNKLIQSDIKIK